MTVLLASAVGCGWYAGYYRLFVLPAEAFDGAERAVLVRVTEDAAVYEDYSSVIVRSVDDTVPHVRMLVYDYDGGMGELRPGDLAEMPLKLRSAGLKYSEPSDAYYSEGVFLRGSLTGAYRVTGRAKLAWLYFPKTLARELRKQAERCFDTDVSGVMQAMLTGNRQAYYADEALAAAMKTAGFTHIVAVSGMHIAFLVGALRVLFGRRRRTAFVCIPLIAVFMAMTGFTPSVVRAGIMQILVLTAALLQRENDPLTALSAAALVLLLENPLAIGSCALQLSFSAMTGLLLVTPAVYSGLTRDKNRARTGKNRTEKLRRRVCATVSASVGAMVFTTPVSALWFGFVPLYAVLTNFLCLWAMSSAFLLGYPVCLLGLLWAPLGRAAGWAVGWLPRYGIFVVKQIAGLPMAAVYTRGNLGAWWLVFTYSVFLAGYLLRGKGNPFRPVIPVCASLLMLMLVRLFPETHLPGCMEFSALDVGQGQSLVLTTDRGSVVIDCGGAGSETRPGEAAAEFLLRAGRRQVDLLVLTHFHADHANGVTELMERMAVSRIAYPADCEETEYFLEILNCCEEKGTALYPIAEDTDMTVDGVSLRLCALPGGETGNEQGLIIRGGYRDFDFLVTGDADSGTERRFCAAEAPGDLELLVVGHHGSRYSTCCELLEETTPEAAIISVGAHNRYGHPTEEVLQRLAQQNTEVYRTDLDGTVTITVGEEDGEERKDGF